MLIFLCLTHIIMFELGDLTIVRVSLYSVYHFVYRQKKKFIHYSYSSVGELSKEDRLTITKAWTN